MLGVQLPTNAHPGLQLVITSESGRVSATNVEDTEFVLGSWLGHGPALAVAVFWEVNQRMKDLCLSNKFLKINKGSYVVRPLVQPLRCHLGCPSSCIKVPGFQCRLHFRLQLPDNGGGGSSLGSLLPTSLIEFQALGFSLA